MKKLLYTIALLFTASTLFISCGSDDPLPEPPPDNPPPEPQSETVRFDNAAISDIGAMLNAARRPNTYVVGSFPRNEQLPASGAGIEELALLLELLPMANVQFNINGATVVPNASGITLTDSQCEILTRLWDARLQFDASDAGHLFKITVAQERFFTAQQLLRLDFTDARTMEISGGDLLSSVSSEAKRRALEGERINVNMTGAWEIPAEYLTIVR